MARGWAVPMELFWARAVAGVAAQRAAVRMERARAEAHRRQFAYVLCINKLVVPINRACCETGYFWVQGKGIDLCSALGFQELGESGPKIGQHFKLRVVRFATEYQRSARLNYKL